MTWTTIDKIDYIVLYALAGQSIEVALTSSSSSLRSPQVLGSKGIKASASNGSISITGSTGGIATVSVGSTRVIIVDKVTALSFWNPRVPSHASPYDVAPDVPSVLVIGPYLVRTASISGNTLELHGDTNTTTTSLDVVAPSSVKRVTWNGNAVKVQPSNIGTLHGVVSAKVASPKLPDLKKATWACTDSLPEIQDGYDDSAWVTADKTNTSRPFQPFQGKVRLHAEHCSFSTNFRSLFCMPMSTGSTLEIRCIAVISKGRRQASVYLYKGESHHPSYCPLLVSRSFTEVSILGTALT